MRCATCPSEDVRYEIVIRNLEHAHTEHSRAYCGRCWWVWRQILADVVIDETPAVGAYAAPNSGVENTVEGS